MNVCKYIIWFSLFSFWYPEELLATGVSHPRHRWSKNGIWGPTTWPNTTGRWRCLNKVVYTFLHHITCTWWSDCENTSNTNTNLIKHDQSWHASIFRHSWQPLASRSEPNFQDVSIFLKVKEHQLVASAFSLPISAAISKFVSCAAAVFCSWRPQNDSDAPALTSSYVWVT